VWRRDEGGRSLVCVCVTTFFLRDICVLCFVFCVSWVRGDGARESPWLRAGAKGRAPAAFAYRRTRDATTVQVSAGSRPVRAFSVLHARARDASHIPHLARHTGTTRTSRSERRHTRTHMSRLLSFHVSYRSTPRIGRAAVMASPRSASVFFWSAASGCKLAGACEARLTQGVCSLLSDTVRRSYAASGWCIHVAHMERH
jgi:hypothetical protein